MTLNKKQRILDLRNDGYSYNKISQELGIAVGTIRYVCSKKETEKCLNCNKPLKLTKGKKAKKFCDDKCRYDYHNSKRKANKNYD